MNLLEQNTMILRQNPMHSIPDIENYNLTTQYVGTDKGEDFFLGPNSEIYIIKNEIEYENLPNPNKRELIIVMGLYSVEEVKAVLEKANENSIIIVIEPNHDMFIYTLRSKDVSFLNRKNVILFSKPINELSGYLERLFKSAVYFLAGNLRYYGTFFYRQYDIATFREVVKSISAAVKFNFYSFGNSIEDSLIGLHQNMQNVKCLKNSRDVSKLKNAFANVPAIIVSAGPSLDKNIQHLKEAQGKAVIIAADTIVGKLLKNGITPNFMCSIERVEEVYTYFYQDKELPQEITLVGPLLLNPNIFTEYKGNVIIPLRKNVGEYIWLNTLLGFDEDSFISMGSSCAHLAFGLANHLGANPIVLIGQDLAYGDSLEKSHTSDTVYDKKSFNSLVNVDILEAPGYFGGKVKTNQIWTSFRKWFEHEIAEKQLFVINATEGGSKIEHTVQMPLEQVIKQYCDKLIDIKQVVESTECYQVDTKSVVEALQREVEQLDIIISQACELKEGLESLRLYPSMDNKKLLTGLEILQKTDGLFMSLFNNFLLRHNMQPEIINSVWKLYDIEEVLTYENIKKNKEIQLDFLKIVIFVAEKIKEYLLLPVETL